ncbi:hypothetical protein EVAR_75891_1 [Eumeta japonica]|uniref:Integrase catalytic domain-containing protein n=1 Tax=Eumeta variegata TaxID=151549 RepID=A0A4C1UWR0_EUMVA|nr:hypothetical protein EVAR_75891_1 [Eumeta japonica]
MYDRFHMDRAEKAIVAASLSADSAIMALRRLAARRGQLSVIYSDNGANFTEANAELRRAWTEIDSTMSVGAVARGIEWRYNPTECRIWEELESGWCVQ